MSKELLSLAKTLKIKVHEPFATYLGATPEECDFEISLLDCYRFAGHACHSMTGAFLSTVAAVKRLFPDGVCVRGDLEVAFGSELNERASGPRANVVSYITGAWGETGFPGLQGRFGRKDLLRFGERKIPKNAIRFHRLSTDEYVDVVYDPSSLLEGMDHGLDFPASWRAEITRILEHRDAAVSLSSK